MRVSTSTMTNLTTNSMSGAYEKYANIINKITSGKNFEKISENPADATKVLKIDDEVAKLNEYQSNIDAAKGEMDVAYDTLNSVTDEITKINSLVIEAANATTTPASAKAIGAEIKERVATVANTMNSKYMDNYIFSGTNTSTRTYSESTDADGNTIYTYNGSNLESSDRNLTIAEGTTMAYNISAENIFTTDDDGKNFFTEMAELNSLLNADDLDYDAIRSKLSVLDKVSTNVTQKTGELSSKVSKLDTTKSLNTTTLTDLTEKKSDLQDVDLTQAATDLSTAQTALQASYSIGTTVLQGVSLLDYI